MSTQLNVPGLPFPLTPSAVELWRVDAGSATVTGSAPARTDIFIDPAGATDSPPTSAESMLNAPTLLGSAPDGDFQFSARVSAGFAATFDAGVLLLWADEQRWAKLCFEFSPAGEPMIVSVVCRGVADDANAFVVDGRSVWLRVSRIGPTYAYHASVDAQTWQLIRSFNLGDDTARAQVGFEAQSPTGDGCTATFDEIRFESRRLADLRDGS